MTAPPMCGHGSLVRSSPTADQARSRNLFRQITSLQCNTPPTCVAFTLRWRLLHRANTARSCAPLQQRIKRAHAPFSVKSPHFSVMLLLRADQARSRAPLQQNCLTSETPPTCGHGLLPSGNFKCSKQPSPTNQTRSWGHAWAPDPEQTRLTPRGIVPCLEATFLCPPYPQGEAVPWISPTGQGCIAKATTLWLSTCAMLPGPVRPAYGGPGASPS